jgi:putative membrane protein
MLYYFNYNHGPYDILGAIASVIIWVLIICLIIALVRRLSWHDGSQRFHGRMRGGDAKTPLDILKERYAKGEIDKQEFEEKKKDIML